MASKRRGREAAGEARTRKEAGRNESETDGKGTERKGTEK